MPRERILLVINAVLDQAVEGNIARAQWPRKDYLELRNSLGADIVDLGVLDKQIWTRVARRLLGVGVAQALLAWILSPRYSAVYIDQESTGFVLAAVIKLRRRRPRLVMIGHFLSPAKKQVLARVLQLHTTIDCVIVHSSLQERIAHTRMNLRREQVALVPYQCDERFWTPQSVATNNQICSVGLEHRDYDTLVKAVDGLGIELIIAAASNWSKHRGMADTDPPPANIRVTSCDYEALRQLYAESLFVVVPLQDVENQSGITVILEAMAMGKAVIVSHARGQTDVVRDRRRRNRADPTRVTQPDWVAELGAADDVAQSQTGIYVMPGDPVELRAAILFLIEHPDRAQLLGSNGRRVVEATMSLDQYTERLSALIRGTSDDTLTADAHESVPEALHRRSSPEG